MKVYCTGISGTEKKGYLEAVVEELERIGERTVLFKMGEMMYEVLQKAGIYVNRKNILNMADETRRLAVSVAHDDALRKESGALHYIYDSHMCFHWNGHTMFSNYFDTIKKVNPDLFITIVEMPEKIHSQLSQRDKWRSQSLSPDVIADWQNLEVGLTELAASEKPHYVISRGEPPTVLADLMKGEKRVAYVSFPMTNLPEEDKKKVGLFVERLRKFFVVFDPRTVEVREGSSSVTAVQTVVRDLNWLVRKADVIVVYIPKLVYTAGVVCEIKEAFEATKDVYVIGGSRGPFERFYSHKWFKDPDEFFSWLDKEGVWGKA